MGHKAILHVFSTFNNVLITATDLTGAETICKVSGGMVTKGGSDSGGQFAATRAAEKIAEMLSEKEFDQVIVKYRGAGGNRSNSAPGATAAIRALTRAGMKITRIEDVTPTPTDGTKSKGGRRGRRV
jgi:small subunit ribosomal protein S11